RGPTKRADHRSSCPPGHLGPAHPSTRPETRRQENRRLLVRRRGGPSPTHRRKAMNKQERYRLLASLTDDELSALRARAGDAAPPDDDGDAGDDGDAERQFLRRLSAKPNNWLAETLDRLSPARPA